MIKQIRGIGAIIVLLLVLFSCGNNSANKQNELYHKLIKTEKGIIRGVKINDKVNYIKKQETKKALVNESASYLEYEYDINEESFIVVAYHFDEKGCSEINIDTYFETEDKAKETVALYQEHFTKKYGKPTIEDELYLWSDDGKAITVEVDYLDQEDGEIMLTIYANE